MALNVQDGCEGGTVEEARHNSEHAATDEEEEEETGDDWRTDDDKCPLTHCSASWVHFSI